MYKVISTIIIHPNADHNDQLTKTPLNTQALEIADRYYSTGKMQVHQNVDPNNSNMITETLIFPDEETKTQYFNELNALGNFLGNSNTVVNITEGYDI